MRKYARRANVISIPCRLGGGAMYRMLLKRYRDLTVFLRQFRSVTQTSLSDILK
jgi:hypothetical protein